MPPRRPRRYRTFVADPPWRYDNTASRGAAENHYPTMGIEEICALRVVPDSSALNAHLYLWITSSHLLQGQEVMQAWGFEYKTSLVWQKPQMGMGNYFRVSTEMVLFGVRGTLPTRTTDLRSVFTSPRRKHSQKPPEFLDMVARASPGPYLELFSRCLKTMTGKRDADCECARCRLGWDVWGNQAAREAAGQGGSGKILEGQGKPAGHSDNPSQVVMRGCAYCDGPVGLGGRAGPSPMYCSAACRTAAWRARRSGG